MLNLLSPGGVLPLDLTPPPAPDLPASNAAVPPPSEAGGRLVFGDLLAASALRSPQALAETGASAAELPGSPAAAQRAEAANEDVAGLPSPLFVPAAIDQPWALVLVPELAALPAAPAPPPADSAEPLPATGAAAGDAFGRGVTMGSPAAGQNPAWPLRSAGHPRLAVAVAPGDPGHGRDWQRALPSAAADSILRNITGQPIPYPTADQPPWFDPAVPPPWFDPANPPPAWSDPTRPPPLWYDPTQLPPAWLDPARIPAAWFAAATAPAIATNAVANLAPAGLQPVPSANSALPPAMLQEPAVLPPTRPKPARRPASPEPPVLGERPQLAGSLPLAALVLPPQPAPIAAAQAATTAPAAGPPSAAEPALTIASDRLGDVAVHLSGGPDQLQVAMQAGPAAAALIGADAPRLRQELADAGVGLAGLSVNGQRADLSGGQRERQRQSAPNDAWRDDSAPIAAARRLAARSPAARAALTVDRFA